VSVEREKHDRSGYRPEVHPILVSCFAQEGLTDAQIAPKLHISRSTLYTWRKAHPEFAETLKFGKDQAEAQVVRSLYQQALKGNVTADLLVSQSNAAQVAQQAGGRSADHRARWEGNVGRRDYSEVR
jgi:transposase-like protein